MSKKKVANVQKGKGTKSIAVVAPAFPITTSAIRDDPILGHKIRVLIYDLCNIVKDASSQKRINHTTDEHYISAPYFSPEQATAVKCARVDVTISSYMDTPDRAYAENQTEDGGIESLEETSMSTRLQDQPLDTAIRELLNNFFDKRRASGDARPCGPHDLAPVYAALFGIELSELKEERFLGRYRRSGVN
ncbi:zinc c6 transcription factor [Ophiostoma piceae UAMH 11346]|uniref:Zinc c6 transcription factor n=1 Tax=Ophiostoma piceae (strain UAMH 11346) TaxID=1262450 RepID=S3CKT9_OPHP1|nr:zinc c6 transcription factor [Ophiostoma piceae UAMH 11346]